MAHISICDKNDNPVFATFAKMVFNKILEEKEVVVGGVPLAAGDTSLDAGIAHLKQQMELIREAIADLALVHMGMMTTETSCNSTTRCCTLDAPAIPPQSANKFASLFTLKFGTVAVTFDLTLDCTPTLLSRDIRGICGANGCENQQANVQFYTVYTGKLILTTDGAIAFGSLCLIGSSPPPGGIPAFGGTASSGGITLEISALGKVVSQTIVSQLRFS